MLARVSLIDVWPVYNFSMFTRHWYYYKYKYKFMCVCVHITANMTSVLIWWHWYGHFGQTQRERAHKQFLDSLHWSQLKQKTLPTKSKLATWLIVDPSLACFEQTHWFGPQSELCVCVCVFALLSQLAWSKSMLFLRLLLQTHAHTNWKKRLGLSLRSSFLGFLSLSFSVMFASYWTNELSRWVATMNTRRR